ncbi:MAG: hypothetical protein WCA81_05685 [Rhizomicrobium sp.]
MNNRTALKLGLTLGLANYLIYIATSGLIGGDVLHAQPSGGMYLLQSSGHVIAVGQTAYIFALAQLYGLVATFPLGLWCACRLSEKSGRSTSVA